MGPPDRGARDGARELRPALALSLSLVAVCVLCALLGWLLRGPLEAVATNVVATLGWSGVLLGVTLAEWSPIPLAGEPFLALARAAGWPLAALAAIGIVGNLLAAALCYPCGAALRRLGLVERVLGARLQAAQEAVERHGAWALVLASFSPLPFGTLAWAAGALSMPLPSYGLACLVRVPKVLLYLGAIELGLIAGR